MSTAIAHLAAALCCGVGLAAFAQAPPNDHFTNAIPLYGNSITFTGSFANATFEPGESQSACSAIYESTGSAWWSWTATNSTQVVIDFLNNPGAYGAGFSVSTGSNVAALTDLDCSYLDNIKIRYVTFAATAGTIYHLRVWGSSASFKMRLTAGGAPVILAQPESQAVPESGSLFAGVVAAGAQPLHYQWLFNGQPMPGETKPMLVLHFMALNRAGAYSVVVSNSTGISTSAVANLTFTSTNAPLFLGDVSLVPGTNRMQFSLTGEAGRTYRILRSYDLKYWWDEESLAPWGNAARVTNTNTTSLYSIPLEDGSKFLRASFAMDTEMCVAHLKELNLAILLYALEHRRNGIAAVSFSDIIPYLDEHSGPVVCPFGGITLEDSYAITDVATLPVCLRVPAIHLLQ